MTTTRGMTAVLIPADLDQNTELIDLGASTLAPLQRAVGGSIEIPFDRSGAALVCNEEGKLRGLQPNVRATILWARLLDDEPADILCGDVVLTGSHGDDLGAPIPGPVQLLLVGLKSSAQLMVQLQEQAREHAERTAAAGQAR